MELAARRGEGALDLVGVFAAIFTALSIKYTARDAFELSVVADQTQEFDQRTLQIHQAPNTSSNLLYKNALLDQAKTPTGPQKNPGYAAMVESADLSMGRLLRTLDEFGVTIGTLQHILEGYKVADEMAKRGVTGSAFSDWWAYKFEVYDAIPYAGALMHENGVVVSSHPTNYPAFFRQSPPNAMMQSYCPCRTFSTPAMMEA